MYEDDRFRATATDTRGEPSTQIYSDVLTSMVTCTFSVLSNQKSFCKLKCQRVIHIAHLDHFAPKTIPSHSFLMLSKTMIFQDGLTKDCRKFTTPLLRRHQGILEDKALSLPASHMMLAMMHSPSIQWKACVPPCTRHYQRNSVTFRQTTPFSMSSIISNNLLDVSYHDSVHQCVTADNYGTLPPALSEKHWHLTMQ